MPANSIRIRMYCQGLGDCFLLTFPRSSGERAEFHILIDCGVIGGTLNGTELINAAVDDIHQTTGGHLDLVVATHEHWDHVSGFNQARQKFANDFQIDAVWLGWTEDPKDPKDLIKKRTAKLKAVRAAVDKLAAGGLASPGMSAQHQRIREVLSFFGDETGPEPPGGPELGLQSQTDATAQPGGVPEKAQGASPKRTTRDALDFLALHPHAAVTYCYPSKPPMPLPGVEGVRVYVFGPPEDPAYLRMSTPSNAAKTYGLTAQAGEDSFIAALSSVGDDPRTTALRDLTYPFEENYRIEAGQVGKSDFAKFFEEHYGLSDKDAAPPRGSEAEQWRRIDLDWLDVTSELALNLDSDTNNTSLVLAFEIGEPGQGKVLLFAADAQVGNWLSWKDLGWQLGGQGGPVRKVTPHQLLGRTVLYKVGHHGSHNATLSELGLDLMNSPDLVALLPVDAKMAVKKGWDEMPFGPLLDTLEEKTRGRIIRIDDAGLPLQSPGSRLGQADWKVFTESLGMASADISIDKGQVIHQKLYVEYYLNL